MMGFSARAQAAVSLDETTGTLKVCEAGPAAESARAERLAGEAAVISSGVLPNPQASIQHQRALSGPEERETIVGLSVPLGIGGRRFLLQEAAQARREQSQANAAATLFDAALSFRQAYVTAILDAARVAALEEQQHTLDEFSSTLGKLAQHGESSGFAQKRLDMQASLHRRLLASMKARAIHSRTILEAWLGEEVTLATPALADLAGGKHRTETTAAIHPRLLSLEAASRASRIEASAAERSWVPDVTVFAGYRSITGSGNDTARGLSMSISIPLTFFDHGQGDAAQAEASAARAHTAADLLRRENAAAAKASIRSLAELEGGEADLDHAVADAPSLGAEAVKLYGAGEATITEVLDAFGAAEAARLARIDLAEEITHARLARMRALGSQFDTALDRACGGATKGAIE